MDIITEIIILKVKSLNLKRIIVAGGGRKNKSLILSLKKKAEAEVMLSEDIGWDGDSLEAQAFGYFATRSMLGKPFTFKCTTGVRKKCSGGILYYYPKN